MSETPNLVSLLNESFAATRAKNPAFSLRSFAKRLGVPPSTLSSLLNGKLPPSKRLAEKILPRLQADPRVERAVLKGFAGARREFESLDLDQFHLIADWHYYAILSLAETKDFRDDPAWIAARLGLTLRVTRAALRRLERLALLARGEEGELRPTNRQFAATSATVSQALRYCNFQNLDLAREKLERCELEQTDFTAITMAVDPARLPEAKRRITKFRRELCEFLEAGERREVYRLFVSLFPLSVLERGKI